jgi:ankyrin repeat protein
LALVQAAERGFKSIIELLIWFGARVDATDSLGDTALMKAIATGKSQTVSLLLKYGANPNKVNYGEFPLGVAISMNKPQIVSKLLLHGADPNKHNEDDSPLGLAISSKNPSIVSELLRCGANPNEMDGREESPLYHSTQLPIKDALCMARLLVEAGAMVDSAALNAAIDNKSLGLIRFMLKCPGVNLTEPAHDAALDHAVYQEFPDRDVINLVLEALTPEQKMVYIERAREGLHQEIHDSAVDNAQQLKFSFQAMLAVLQC